MIDRIYVERLNFSFSNYLVDLVKNTYVNIFYVFKDPIEISFDLVNFFWIGNNIMLKIIRQY